MVNGLKQLKNILESWLLGRPTVGVEREGILPLRYPGTERGIAKGRATKVVTGSRVLFITGQKSGTAGQRGKIGFVSHNSIHQLVVADEDSEAEARLS